MVIIPAIDLRGGRCVRLRQGRKQEAKVYDEDPVAVARNFASEGAEILHIVDLDAAFSEDNSQNRQLLDQLIKAIEVPVQLGGGLRTWEDIEHVRQLGVARVVIGTIAAESPGRLAEMLERFGSKIVIVGIDAREGKVATRGWEAQSDIEALELARRVRAAGVERVVYTDIGRDGMLSGPDVEQTAMIARETGLKVTASGGISSLEDLEKIRVVSNDGVDSVIIGKAFYEGRFTLSAALALEE